MRRTVGIVVGAIAALALAGVAGVTYAQRGDAGRVVGTWHEAPGVARSPVAVQRTTERVGTLKKINKLIGYAPAPQHQTFRHPAASYVKLHFSRVALLPGDYLTVSAPTGRETHRYAAPQPGTPTARWAMSITGDTAVLRVHRARRARPVPVGIAFGTLGVTVDRVARGFTQRERASETRPASLERVESVCGSDESVDAVCYRSTDPVAYTRSRAVARLLINGIELCTGFRVGFKNRMLTNNHCLDDSADARQTEIWFNYRCATCGGIVVTKPTKVWGGRVLSTNRTYDFTLFTVGRFDLIRGFGNMTLDIRRPSRTQELYIPQHPAGQPTRISGAYGERAGTCTVLDNAYDGYARDSDVSYYCDTKGGSSGSPVLSRFTDKVVALHHFGGCPNSGIRADLVYRKIKTLI